MTGLIDGVIAVVVVEAVVLTIHHRVTGKGIAPRNFAAALAAGLCLMLALRLASPSATPWLAALLALAGAAHLLDLRRRWSA